MKVLLACGGTGGHLFPGIALAEAFEEKVGGVEIVFVGTPRGLEKEVLSKTCWRLELMTVPSLADKKHWRRLFAGFRVLKSVGKAALLIRKEKPQLAVGIGGYAAGPVMLAAALLRKPTLVLEPNAIPGMTNRFLKPFVDKVAVAYPGMEKIFGKKKTLFLGVPVRKSLLKDAAGMASDSQKYTIFVFGGSQGSRRINDALLTSLFYLQDLKEELHFIHQIGRQDRVEHFEKTYRENGFSAEVHPFIERIGLFYGRSDLVIARSGANTLAELCALKKPSLLIPYPFAAAGHQEANARSLEKAGGARVLLESDLSDQQLALEIRRLLTTEGVLKTMAQNLERMGTAGAAGKIVEACLELV